MTDLYRFVWRITASSAEPARVRIVTLNGPINCEISHVATGHTIDLVGAFGTDLCVLGGHADLEMVSNEIPPDRLGASAPYRVVEDPDCFPDAGV